MALDDKEEAALKKQLAEMETDRDKWKGFSRQHEDRAKENAAAAEELKTLKASSQTDQQRREAAEAEWAKKLKDLEDKLGDESKARLRAEVAAAKGLTPAQAKRLSGTTQDELEADADDILENFKPVKKDDADDDEDPSKKPRPATRPKTQVTGGGDPTVETTQETNPAKLAESVPQY